MYLKKLIINFIFNLQIIKMKIPCCCFMLLFLPLVLSQCPEIVDISPCKCTEENDQRRLSCWGNMELPRFTHILRDVMCGRTIEKFELLGTNITYLSSNLFSRMIIYDINVSRMLVMHKSSIFFSVEI